ncbi:RNA polymerase primary sigma factor [Elusimicrobium posterum]|uniref:sigma-70 family RNA polymerase sigma factor n=1 Tax=Elusimicrobium posterum TaxID=3116653 RepID=UPI003C7403CA
MSENVDSLNEYLKMMGEVSKEADREEMERLWKRIGKGDADAKQRMMELNLRLVIPLAKRFMRPGIDLLDLIEEGNLGLMQAIEKFEPAKGFRFSTYATYWIEQGIRKHINEQSGAIKIPSHAWGDIKKWTAAWHALKNDLGRDPSLTEMSEALDLSARKIKSILDTMNAAKGIDSLSMSVGDEEDVTLEDIVSDHKGSPDDLFSKNDENKELLSALDELLPRDKQILMMRHGLETNEPMTLGEVAEVMGLSRERVRQIEERAVSKIRKKAQKLGILEQTATEDRRTRKLHTGMDIKHSTNVLGEITGNSTLERILRARMEELKKRTDEDLKKPAKKGKKETAPEPAKKDKKVKGIVLDNLDFLKGLSDPKNSKKKGK